MHSRSIPRRAIQTTSRIMLADAPIHYLPNEILSEIFYQACPSSGANSATLFPIHITHVCSTWRDLAIHLPCLWTRIIIDESMNDSQGHYSLVSLYLSRSSPQPFDLSITIPCPNLCHLIFQHSARFRTWHLLLTPEHIRPQSPLVFIKDNIPLVEEIGFDWEILPFSQDPPADPNDNSTNPKRRRRTCALGDIPKLQRLNLYSVDCYISRIGFPWMQIRHLTLTSSWSNNIDEALFLCPNLESAHFDYIYVRKDYSLRDDPTPFTCASLSKLSVNASYGRVGFLPQYAQLPSLEELELGGPGENDTDCEAMVEDIQALLKRSTCLLQSLTITGKGIPSSHLTTLLSGIPSLTSFSFSNYYGTPGTDLTDEFLERLILPCDAAFNAPLKPSLLPPLLPKLSRLTLKHRPLVPVNIDLILPVLESRRCTHPCPPPCAGTTKASFSQPRLLRHADSPQPHSLLRYADLGNLYGLGGTCLSDVSSRLQKLQADGLEVWYMLPG
ncbi:hypothetical protein D9758_007618 [Tetrapyrgos nigripes]|uniref:F-box domain-containing protein n=1 Tax=Tetrapyrgos nigripes TaxID=182062 RepID=A0A8H5G826_9AGAR|nr:hypothetical protein D9758_007618 [Tetrapyrgos nigripes]